MANEINITYTGSNSIYAIIRRTSDNLVWNATTFVSWSDGDIDNYDIQLSSAGGDYYTANFPSAISTGILYRVLYYEQSGASPSTSDIILSSESGYWDGSSLVESLVTGTTAVSTDDFDDTTLLYCTVENVKKILPRNITRVLDQRNRHSQPVITEDDIGDYIRRAQVEIDGELSELYTTPLRRIVEVDLRLRTRATSHIYPDPIPFIAQRYAAAMIYNERFTGDGGNIDGSVFGDRYYQQAQNKMKQILTGVIDLKGQRRTGWRYGRPESRNIKVIPHYAKRVEREPIK